MTTMSTTETSTPTPQATPTGVDQAEAAPMPAPPTQAPPTPAPPTDAGSVRPQTPTPAPVPAAAPAPAVASVPAPAPRASRPWDATARRAACAVTAAALVAAAGEALAHLLAPTVAACALGIGALALAGMTGRAGRPGSYARTVLPALAAGCPLPFAYALLADGVPAGDALLAALFLAWAVLWLGVGFARSDTDVSRGARIGAGLALLHLVAVRTLPDAAAHAVAAVAAVAVGGVLPWRALSRAGVLGPLAGSAQPDDAGAAASLRAALRGLTWSVVAVGATTAVALSALVRVGGGLPIALVAVALVVTGRRAATYVERPQVAALWAAVAVPVLVLLLAGPFTDSPAVVVALAAVGVAVLVAVGARRTSGVPRGGPLRRLSEAVEQVGVPVVWILALVVVIGAVSGKVA